MAATLTELYDYINTHQAVAELRQDIFVVSMTGFKKSGFFVEFGLMDGITASNSYLMEKEYDWNGIVCEPAKVFHDDVVKNRKCTIDFRAVTERTGDTVKFKEVESQLGLSSVIDTTDDMHSTTRAESDGKIYDVSTVSLTDLLDQHHAPQHIDYISMDTEGSELSILEAFDFSKYTVDIFTIEHNYVNNKRQKIFELMTLQGYQRVFTDLSQYDDWYIHTRLMS